MDFLAECAKVANERWQEHDELASKPQLERDEAWLYTMERAIGPWSNHIDACLRVCEGNVREAVKLSRQLCKDSLWLNNWRETGHRGLTIDSNMTDRDADIDVWLNGRSHGKPDFRISWEQVFAYVRDAG